MLSHEGYGSIDYGDTPAYAGVYDASANVVGRGARRPRAGDATARCYRTFQPIGGLHHAARSRAAGFCVFNDCGVVIETLRSQYGMKRVAYVDIDVHHGDGLFYPFEEDPDVVYADIHEDGRYLYPGTGTDYEMGKGAAEGLKLNIPMQPGWGDNEFFEAWERVLEHLREHKPEFIVFQAGADSLAGDPLAHLQYTPKAHAHAARSLVRARERDVSGAHHGFRRRRLQPPQPRGGVVRGSGRVRERVGTLAAPARRELSGTVGSHE